MKKTFTLLCCCICLLAANAQWSNTSNQFYDSLHMPACTVGKDQDRSISLRSYPDSGYIVIWQDFRNNNWDIYAQKYDKAGNPLWAANGVPVATGPDDQQYSRAASYDYREYSYTATDSAGGFYITWIDNNSYNSGVTNKQRICIQHLHSNGTAVFPGIGYVLSGAGPAEYFACGLPQLIPDGKNGFFVGFLKAINQPLGGTTGQDLFVYNFIDENGTLKYLGGGKMDPDQAQGRSNSYCLGTNQFYSVNYYEEFVQEFQISNNHQQGCDIAWIFSRNGPAPLSGPFIAYNSLCRVKKNATVTVARRVSNLDTTQNLVHNYTAGTVTALYNLKTFNYTVSCRNPQDGSFTTENNERIENGGNGYQLIDFYPSFPGIGTVDLYAYERIKTTVIETGGNANALIIAVNQRNYLSTGWSQFYTHGFYRVQDEVYDSLPYQLCSDLVNTHWALNITKPAGMDKIRYGDDTLLASSNYAFDYTLSSGGNNVFVAGKLSKPSLLFPAEIALQSLSVNRAAADSFTIRLTSGSRAGVVIGKDVYTGFQGSSVLLGLPSVKTDSKGNGLFYISEYGRYLRASPIGNNGSLLWGALGKPIGNGFGNDAPFASLGNDGTGILTWTDNRQLPGNSNYDNDIYLRHLDSLSRDNYIPFKKLQSFKSFNWSSLPLVLTGTSKAFSELVAAGVDINSKPLSNPIAAIFDDYSLGYLQAQVYDNNGPVRRYNGKVYLNRNYTLFPENNPNGAASVKLRLYFTDQQLEQLKAADPSVSSPANLVVIKQPNGGATAPEFYTPVPGEEIISPTAWEKIDGGYYLEITVTSFSNFFIQQGNAALPVKWVDLQAARKNSTEALVQWRIADEINVKSYTVQASTDGLHFQNTCTVAAGNRSLYNCNVAAADGVSWYFRILQIDVDGRTSTSKTVILKKSSTSTALSLSPNPAHDYAVLHLNGSAQKIESISLINTSGISIWRQNSFGIGVNNINIPLQNISKGVYYLHIKQAGTTQNLKLIKQ